MAEKEFPEPDKAVADERASLTGWLDYHRGVLVWKLDGLSDEDLRRPMVPSGTSLLGLVKHVTVVEEWWFQAVFTGRKLDYPRGYRGFELADTDTGAAIVAAYRKACAESRAITDAAQSLDQVAIGGRWEPPRRAPNLRWILGHMVEETARHNGHADILRELIDGTIGD